MGQRSPTDLPCPTPAVSAGREGPSCEPANYAIGRTGNIKGRENLCDGRPDFLAWVHDCHAVIVVNVPNRERKAKAPAACRCPF
jgi:hypothetical protein